MRDEVQPSRTKVTMWRFAVIFTIVLLWEAGYRCKILDPFFFSSPSAIVSDLWRIFASGTVYKHLAVTMEEMLLGLGTGTILGIVVGFVLSMNETVARSLDPLIMGTYAIPKIAIAPLFILWFGLGITAKFVFAMMIVFFLVFFNTYAGLKNTSPVLIRAVRAMGAGNFAVATKVFLPSCTPWILTAVRASIGRALVGAIVAEFIASDTGLGWMILTAAGLFNTTRIMSVVLILSTLVIVMDQGVRFLENRLLRWRPSVSAIG